MLRFLAVRNLAVIDSLELEFEPGLNVLTGETGAGKSILVGAVGLLAGGRASADLVRTGADLATVEAIFETPDGAELIVRRDVSAQSGRSRAFLNGTLVTSAVLRDHATRLVDLHGQHEHQLLLDPASHLDLLDAFAGLDAERARVAEAYRRWQALAAEQDRLTARTLDRARRGEFVAFQLAEIRRAAVRPDEDDELAASRQILAHAERLQRLGAEAYALLYDGEGAALTRLSAVWKKVGELAAIDPQFQSHLLSRDSIKPQLEDLAYFLRSYVDEVEASPERLQAIEDRLAVLERLKKKHGPTLADVIRSAVEFERELEEISGSEDRASQVEADLADARAAYQLHAGDLSARRKAAAVAFGQQLEGALADLAMAGTRCEVRFDGERGEADWSARGSDRTALYLSPNPGEELRPLARIASGGELSRIMLAIKTLASTDDPGKALVFDEVDAGIGGTVADVVGARLRALGDRAQVLCITHLPQIAAHGTTHYRIAKDVRDGRTVTRVTRLTPREREGELARMLAGAEVSGAMRTSAREMLKRRSESK
jgi:DNA repair protein RecN (Recombination protein N)